MTEAVKSPLRYPGGKSRAVKRILSLIPDIFREYREPFVGGGSVFLAVKSTRKSLFEYQTRYVINDINYDLACFWRTVRDNLDPLCQAVEVLRNNYKANGKRLYFYLTSGEFILETELDRAVRFFIMNRITFSGVMDAGGYSQQAFDTRFTASSIARLRVVAPTLAGTTIEAGDYESQLFAEGEEIFVFLDPPYHSTTSSKLYGEKGQLHTSFDHERFALSMRQCPHRWLITYDDSEYIRDLFSFAHIREWQLQYGMNNFKQATAAIGNELFITNY